MHIGLMLPHAISVAWPNQIGGPAVCDRWRTLMHIGLVLPRVIGGVATSDWWRCRMRSVAHSDASRFGAGVSGRIRSVALLCSIESSAPIDLLCDFP